jgi:hypothetical protein
MERLSRIKGKVCLLAVACRSRGPVLVILVLLTVVFSARAGTDSDVVVETDQGTVNWTRGYIEAEAVKAPSVKSAITAAAAAAQAEAREKLTAVAYGVPVDTFQRVRDTDTERHHLLAGIRRLVAGLPVHKQQYLSDGTVRISLRLNLTGAFAQLVLPPGIRHIESIQTVKKAGSRSAEENALPPTGLVIDARGTGLRPALVPGVLDENGRQVYGELYASREAVVQWGMCRYFRDPEVARQSPRVADRPLMIQGLRAAGPGETSVVINNTDADRIRSDSETIALLRNCRVVIVVD